jgi:NAD(P)-dependent dehydrogenase (short-subunit alcohol dehydrogenase family)
MNESTKVALVTGGGSGLGLAIAEKFIANGIVTVISGRDAAKLKMAKESLGDLCSIRVCDLNNLDTIPGFIESVIQEFGHIDILVNNAGINQKKEFTEVTDEEFQRILTTNVCAVFAISREVVRYMLPHGAGCILNISSMASQYGLPHVIAYTASKSAIEGMTKAMAVELSPRGIRVNAIAPGFIYSAMSANALDSDPERKAKVISRTPMGHMGLPEDIGSAASYLVSDAAKYITGVILPVDGGNSIGF